MRILAALLLLAPAAGCVIDTTERDHGDGGHGPTEVATISARWAFRNMLDGATTACPTGFDTVRLITQPIDANGDPTGDPNIDLYNCGARTGISTDLPPDVYQVWLEVWTHDLSELYAQSLSQILDVRTADDRFDADILNDGGFFQLSWDLVDPVTHRPLACAQAGSDGVHAVSTSVADAHRVYDDFRACDDHTSVTDGLLAGAYTVTLDAMTGDRAVGSTMTLTNQKIEPRNHVTDLGMILLPVAAK